MEGKKLTGFPEAAYSFFWAYPAQILDRNLQFEFHAYAAVCATKRSQCTGLKGAEETVQGLLVIVKRSNLHDS
jgi:hypothetical protein